MAMTRQQRRCRRWVVSIVFLILVGSRLFSEQEFEWNIQNLKPIRGYNSSAVAYYYDSTGSLPLCTREQIRSGEWIPTTLPEIPYTPIEPACFEPTTKPWHTWTWQPSAVKSHQCTLIKWNAQHFCSLVKFTTVAIMGDSMSREQFISLVQLLGEPFTKADLRDADKHGRPFLIHACHGQVRLVYSPDVDLSKVETIIESTSPQVIILNRGAHFTNDTMLLSGLERLIPVLRRWEDSCLSLQGKEQQQQRCHLLVRTSVPGHPQCWNFTKPVKSVEEMELFVNEKSNHQFDNKTWYYHWYDYQHQNNLSLKVYQSIDWRIPFDIMDAYYINVLRPDEHLGMDCLHSCFPGKMDVYNQLLVHFLQQSGGVASPMKMWIRRSKTK